MLAICVLQRVVVSVRQLHLMDMYSPMDTWTGKLEGEWILVVECGEWIFKCILVVKWLFGCPNGYLLLLNGYWLW